MFILGLVYKMSRLTNSPKPKEMKLLFNTNTKKSSSYSHLS